MLPDGGVLFEDLAAGGAGEGGVLPVRMDMLLHGKPKLKIHVIDFLPPLV
jgi:hypothetical protein